jgi:outer membrane protein TolC
MTANGELSVDALVQQVLARNPSLEQMAAAYQAAAAKYPQVTALDDPMFGATLGPATIRPDDTGVEFAYRLEVAQKVPWPGKLRLRGENALAEARAAANEVDDMRLQLIESAKDAFYEYFLAQRALDVNDDSLRLLRDFRESAATRFRTGLVPQQNLLQADVEIGREQQRREALERMRQNVLARLNTLMHLPPDLPLPPPPQRLGVGEALPGAAVLRAAALARRPDLLALANRIQAEEALLALAHKEYYPDFEPFLMYDRFMGNTTATRDLATMVGVRLNLPVRATRRSGAVAEAQARIAQRRAELARETDKANLQVQQAYDQVRESERVVRRYEGRILPDAKLNVEAAQSAYVTGKIPFLTLVEAQRTLVSLRERYYEAVADYHRRLATLERAAGGPLVPPAEAPEPGVPPGSWAEPVRR